MASKVAHGLKSGEVSECETQGSLEDDIMSAQQGSGDEDDAFECLEAKQPACSYCSVDFPNSLVMCKTCDKWFCNAKSGSSTSHIVNHLVLSRHKEVSLHPNSELGDTVLECYNCGCKNLFVLGFVSAKSEAVVVILCRLPCAQMKNVSWDTEQWQSLIENRQLLHWVAEEPSKEQQKSGTPITPSQMAKLEVKWRSDKDATIDDLELANSPVELQPIPTVFTDAKHYCSAFSTLIDLEAECDRQLKESQALQHISVKWSMERDKKYLASFSFSTSDANGLRVAAGDEIVLKYSGMDHPRWEDTGIIVRAPSNFQGEFVIELKHSKPPVNITNGFTAEFVWKGTSYARMQKALKRFAKGPSKKMNQYIYHVLLGKELASFDKHEDMPNEFSIPNFIELNPSQRHAVGSALASPLTLIQGPPGTGKTVTSAAIVYEIAKKYNERVLVCAPSNVAVDHLAFKLHSMGLKVVRMTARSREYVETSVSELSLHNLVKRSATGSLAKMLDEKDANQDSYIPNVPAMRVMAQGLESAILRNSDVVCCTCVTAGDFRLNTTFKTVLIDESTQASEPECLIPIVSGVRRLVLVGDHQQLGPVILDRKASSAGLNRSLFERLVAQGHVPIRLEVQYRMNPHLSEFPSNMFYEGILQNGVTVAQRTIANSKFPWPIAGVPMMFWANYGSEEISANGTSFLNRIEAMNCEKVITRLLQNNVKPEQIGVITPYDGQKIFIVQYMQMNGTLDKDLYANVEVASVDAFQGREKDYIILSCVRSNTNNSIGFLVDPRRLNVGLTRARYGLVILGNPTSLCKSFIWNKLLTHFREKGCLVDGTIDNLQLCTAQLNSNKKKMKKTKTAENEGWSFDNKSGFSALETSNNLELDTQGLMSFGADEVNKLFRSSDNLSALLKSQSWTSSTSAPMANIEEEWDTPMASEEPNIKTSYGAGIGPQITVPHNPDSVHSVDKSTVLAINSLETLRL